MSGRTIWSRTARGARHRIGLGAGQSGGQVPGMSYGGYKQSFIGREFSLEGMLDSFTLRKIVAVNLAV
jgi:acyl-CoA reductase-like NAD-dependent aldehyde dehydrogenase